jgi:hypothetical protein
MDRSLISVSAAELYHILALLRRGRWWAVVARTPSTPMIGHAISF